MTKKESYLVEGMTCSGCQRTVSKVISNLDGVVSAVADFSSSTVNIEYNPFKVSIGNIRDAISGVGYKLVGERPAHGEREGSDEAIA
jgi:mercuric ion transport protein